MAIMRIDVTAEDIAQGVRWSCRTCPVALAITRAIGKGVEICTVIIVPGFKRRGTPKDVRTFINAFDRGLAVQPFSFDLELIEENNA